MKFSCLNKLICTILLFIVSTLSMFSQQQNGGVITLNGDTVLCDIASKPGDIGLKKKKGDAYLFDCVVAIFPTDSVRLLYPWNINGFFFKSELQNNPQLNWYFSDSVNLKHDMLIKNPPRMRPVFFQQLVTGGFYHLWYFEQVDPGYPNDRIFILEEVDTGQRHIFNTNQQLKKLLGKWPASDKQDSRYKDWFKGKQLMVIDYNKYKSGK
jgi:hypothetical protein